jgi:hypothetical protein
MNMATPAILEVGALVDAFLTETDESTALQCDPADFATGRQILELPAEQHIAAVSAILERQVPRINGPSTCGSDALTTLLQTLLRKRLPCTALDLEVWLGWVAQVQRPGWWASVAPGSILRAVTDHVDRHGMPPSLRDALRQLACRLSDQTYYAEPRKLRKQVEALLTRAADLPAAGTDAEAPATLVFRRPRLVELTTDEAWTRYLRSCLNALVESARDRWDALLAHCATAGSAKPTQKWLRQAESLVQEIGADAFAPVLVATLAELGKPGGARLLYVAGMEFPAEPTTVHDAHSDLLRGLIWCASVVPPDEVVAAVGRAADVCFHKIPQVGPRAPKIGNACLVALAGISSTAAVGQLSRIRTRAKHVSIKKQLAKALDTAAEKAGLSPVELEEVAVPTGGLTAVGEHRQPLGDFTAVLRVTDELRTELTWQKPDGRVQASVPAAVKGAFPAEVKALKQQLKELAQLVPAQRLRLEALFLEDRSWPLTDFRTRFLDHPLVGVVARRLIWRFCDGPRTADGIWHSGRIVDEQGRPLEGYGETTRVSLWHPLHSPVDRVKAWRDWLEAHAVRQPFKQAYREVYLLTEAERQTGSYSNRFAAHLLKQHQFAALCRERGWRYALQGDWDSANTPVRELPRWNLRAEFWVQAVRIEGAPLEGTDRSTHGIFLYLSTDQVRFTAADGLMARPLASVPPLVFSEVMRDVDLFVGVASVGNDPTWADGGPTGHYREYWQRYAFGELMASAATRKAALERIVPRLKIADRCSFNDRFLVVRGDLRTYKIHLGSGNILMAPNDQYLCIVPRPSVAPGGGKVYLPFEGDAMLTIILSKALLLAEDRKITEPSIRWQIDATAPMPVE